MVEGWGPGGSKRTHWGVSSNPAGSYTRRQVASAASSTTPAEWGQGAGGGSVGCTAAHASAGRKSAAAGAPVAAVGQLRVILQSLPGQQPPGKDESNHHGQHNRCSASSTREGGVSMRVACGWHGWQEGGRLNRKSNNIGQ